MMMTPVYCEAIASWSTNSCGINNIAARLDLSVFSNVPTRINHTSITAVKHLDYYYFDQLKKSSRQLLHLLKRERQNCFLYTLIEPQALSNSYFNRFLQALESCQHRFRNIFFSFQVISITYHRLTTTGTDALWQQKRFDLKVTNCEKNVLDGYIKEQPAGHPITANDEEK
mgnify:CR=1 FL=1